MIPEKIKAIEQRAFLRGYQKFEMFHGGELEVTFKRFSSHNQFKFPLVHLNPSPTRVKLKQVGSLVGSIIIGLCGLGTIAGMIVSRDSGIAVAMTWPLLLFLVFVWVAFSRLHTSSVDANVYHFRDGKGQIHIWYEKPDVKTFCDFCEALTKAAEEAWNSRSIEPISQSLAGELTTLKKLKDENALSEKEFEAAKTKLLSQPEQGKIGF